MEPTYLDLQRDTVALNIKTEALIIGAGPVGLFQAFELGLLGIDCCIAEALGYPGGQCTELYADKPIYDIPGTAYTTAADLIAQLQKQIQPFNIDIHYQQNIESLEKTDQGFIAVSGTGSTFTANQVFLATGAGAFTPVKLRTEGINEFEGTQVFYTQPDDSLLSGKSVVIIGDDQTAVDCAIDVCTYTSNTIFLHRKRRLEASEQSLAQLKSLSDNNEVQQIKGKIIDFTENGELQEITIQQNKELSTTHPVDLLLVKQGNSPKQSNLQSWGITTAAKQVPVDPASYETNAIGIYAVGDINSYPAKRKLILCGFHEATLAAFAAAAKLSPEKPVHLQYTTTSTELRQRLGVATTNQG